MTPEELQLAPYFFTDPLHHRVAAMTLGEEARLMLLMVGHRCAYGPASMQTEPSRSLVDHDSWLATTLASRAAHHARLAMGWTDEALEEPRTPEEIREAACAPRRASDRDGKET